METSPGIAFAAIAIATGVALLLWTFLSRRRLALFVSGLHVGQFAILMLPGILALGFYYQAMQGLGGGPYQPLVIGLDRLTATGLLGEAVTAAIIGCIFCLPLQMLFLVWIWFGEKNQKMKSKL